MSKSFNFVQVSQRLWHSGSAHATWSRRHGFESCWALGFSLFLSFFSHSPVLSCVPRRSTSLLVIRWLLKWTPSCAALGKTGSIWTDSAKNSDQCSLGGGQLVCTVTSWNWGPGFLSCSPWIFFLERLPFHQFGVSALRKTTDCWQKMLQSFSFAK